MCCLDISTADGAAHESNGLYDVSRNIVNGCPIYVNRNSYLRLWWVEEEYTDAAPPKQEGELAARDKRGDWLGASWIVGSQKSVGTDWGCMYIKSSEQWARERTTGVSRTTVTIRTMAKRKTAGSWHWAKQRHFQSDITVTVHEDDESDFLLWMDYNGCLAPPCESAASRRR